VQGRTAPVKVGIPIGDLSPAVALDVAVEADRLGYDSLWLPEHLAMPVGAGGSPFAGDDATGHAAIPPETPFPDQFVFLAHLAARTARIRLATHVFNIGLRHPFTTARAVATLDIVSGGRLDFGVGASWQAEEWRAVGLDFASRGQRVDEALEVCRRLWSEQVVAHEGAFFSFGPVMFEPKPMQKPWPPVHIGGDGPAAIRRAATVGDGWVPMNHHLSELAEPIARIAALREAAGRPGRTEVTFWGPVRSPSDFDRYADAGVDRVLARPWRRDEDPVEGVRRFAAELLGVPSGR
jgi:probable F420-dependent oxidoreductase